MTTIIEFLSQYESEIDFLRQSKNFVKTIIPPHDFFLDNMWQKTRELHLLGIDHELLLYILSCWARHVNRLADEEVVKGVEENEKFVRRFFEEAEKVADFSLLDRKKISNSDLLDLISGYKRARGLQQNIPSE